MSEIEKMRRYIEKYKVPCTPRYDASINEIIAIASGMSPMEAANFAFVYAGLRVTGQEKRRGGAQNEDHHHLLTGGGTGGPYNPHLFTELIGQRKSP